MRRFEFRKDVASKYLETEPVTNLEIQQQKKNKHVKSDVINN